MPKKQHTVQHGKRDRGDDEGHTPHKKGIDRDKKSPTSHEVNIFKEKEKHNKSPNSSKDGLDLTANDQKSIDNHNECFNEGTTVLVQFDI